MKLLLIGVFLSSIAYVVAAQEFNNIEYLSPDWGPAMTLPSKAGEQPQFDDDLEEIYFIKQVGSFTRKKLKMRDPFSGRDTADEGHGISIYLCKMKPDGSDKMELKQLWRNPNYPIDTQGQSCWLDVNSKTHKIALAIAYAGNDITGLWTMNLDGSDLKRTIKPEQTDKHLQAINHPSWTPDGQWIVFEEELRGMNPNQYRIAKCDTEGNHFIRLTDGKWEQQPAVSSDGKEIAYVHTGDAKTGGLYLMTTDGHEQHMLPNPNDKRYNNHSGLYPAWSPDAKNILLSCEIIDAVSGKLLLERRPLSQGQQWSHGWPHWGTLGIVGFGISGIQLTDLELKETRWIGSSRLVECSSGKECRW